jgi:hypothetical protein
MFQGNNVADIVLAIIRHRSPRVLAHAAFAAVTLDSANP